MGSTFRLLADFPRIGQPVDELVAGDRRFRFQSHYIFYTEEAAHILIRAIIHSAQEIRPQLFDQVFTASAPWFVLPFSRRQFLRGDSTRSGSRAIRRHPRL